MLGAEMTETDIEHHLGPFGPVTVKPHSRTRRAMDGSALLKVYVEIDPEGRRRREADTVGRAVLRGVSAPAVLATGKGEAGAWTVFRMLPGTPCSIGAHEAIEEYIGHVLDVSGRVHQPAVDLTPGFGWERRQAGPVSQHQFLLDQLSSRCRGRSWWGCWEGSSFHSTRSPWFTCMATSSPSTSSSTASAYTSWTGRPAPAVSLSSITPTSSFTSYVTCCTRTCHPSGFRSIS